MLLPSRAVLLSVEAEVVGSSASCVFYENPSPVWDVECVLEAVWWLCLLEPGRILSHTLAAALESSRVDF